MRRRSTGEPGAKQCTHSVHALESVFTDVCTERAHFVAQRAMSACRPLGSPSVDIESEKTILGKVVVNPDPDDDDVMVAWLQQGMQAARFGIPLRHVNAAHPPEVEEMQSILRSTRRVLVVALGCMALAVFVAAPAFGAYTSGAGALGIPTTVSAGEAVSLSFSGCAGATAVTVNFDSSSLGSITSDSSGNVNGSITIPSGASAGSHTVTASCADPAGGTLTVSQDVTVAGASTSGLPFTGATVLPLVFTALGLCVIGGIAAFATRRRRSTTAV